MHLHQDVRFDLGQLTLASCTYLEHGLCKVNVRLLYSWANSLEQSTSDGAVCTVTVYNQVIFEDISFSLRFQY